jgi:hypothetical protein
MLGIFFLPLSDPERVNVRFRELKNKNEASLRKRRR